MTTTKYLKDYCEPNYWINTINLDFNIQDNEDVLITSITHYHKNMTTKQNTLTLSGSAELISIHVNDKAIPTQDYTLENDELHLANLPNEFHLTIVTKVQPYTNKTCMGLYGSGNTLFTQNEPEGFRKITYYLDRPDVMAIFTTSITANPAKYPVLLSNGNKIKDAILSNGKKSVTWQDPFKKPSYLFALVAGDLAHIKDTFTTKSGRKINLEVYSKQDDLYKCQHAMESLKHAMKWDETRFNLEYDLDNYMIVAASDFNMGAMENKGLNIFNTKYVFATSDSATDNDFIAVEAVIGHEYFHNWTGNRVTCKNWFQLSLKEGLTVFRDQEFTADRHGHSVNRIGNVKRLRQAQFSEDSGPLAHAVRPEEYIEMNNFYTTTVYEKGAEVVRMYQSILGKDGFNKGLELYFKRHDGQAVTCEDFCNAMANANDIDLSQFMLWYSQAGTPHVTVTDNYNAATQTYTLNFKQSIPDTPKQNNKKAMLIPIKIGLLDNSGHEILNLQIKSGRFIQHSDGTTLLLDNNENTFEFTNVKTKPVPSLLRQFSAPVKLHYNYTDADHLLLIANDSDEFNQWEHLQQILVKQIKAIYRHVLSTKTTPIIDKEIFSAMKSVLNNTNLAANFRAYMFELPNFSEMAIEIKDANPEILQQSIDYLAKSIGEELFDSWLEIYNLNLTMAYKFADQDKRSLKNTALRYIIKSLEHKLDNPSSLQLIETLALGQYHNADNMTDSFAVLATTANLNIPLREQILQDFYNKWQHNELVMDKWFAVQAMSKNVNANTLNKLMVDKAFIATNPNKIYALLRNFTANGVKFNSQFGYEFIADQIIMIAKFNPSVASILSKGYGQVINLQMNYQQMAKNSLNLIMKQENLPAEVSEVVSKTLAGIS